MFLAFGASARPSSLWPWQPNRIPDARSERQMGLTATRSDWSASGPMAWHAEPAEAAFEYFGTSMHGPGGWEDDRDRRRQRLKSSPSCASRIPSSACKKKKYKHITT